MQSQLNLARGTVNAKMEDLQNAKTLTDIAAKYFVSSQCEAVGAPPTFSNGKHKLAENQDVETK